MKYQYREGDRIFFKLVISGNDIPLDDDELEKALRSLTVEEIFVFRRGVVNGGSRLAIVQDFDRMGSYQETGNFGDVPEILPKTISKILGAGSVQQLSNSKQLHE